jgi:hypothetical protein
MYIPEFWCGVASVIFAEIIVIVALLIIGDTKGGSEQ